MDDGQDQFPQNLFVGRELLLQILIEWVLALTVPRRLKAITAPPGYGKSWFLRKLAKRLEPKHSRELFLIWAPTLRLRSKAEIARWLPSVVEEAKKYCPEVRTLDAAAPPEAIIAALLEDLSKHCSPNLRPILIVDAFDELLDNERRELEKHLLERFWANPNVRIIMAFRDELSLRSPTLRRGEDRLHLGIFSEYEGREQLTKRQELLEEKVQTSIEVLLEWINPYPLSVPGINTIIFERVRQNEASSNNSILNPADIRACWRELIGPKLETSLDTVETIEKDLQQITALSEDSWTLESFADKGGYTQTNALYRIQSLMALSVVVQAGGQRYKIVDGLRELLYAEARLSQGGKGI